MTTPSRTARCHVLDRLSNRCPNPDLGEGFCLSHLERAVLVWADRVAAVIDQLGGEDADKLRAVTNTLKRYCGQPGE